MLQSLNMCVLRPVVTADWLEAFTNPETNAFILLKDKVIFCCGKVLTMRVCLCVSTDLQSLFYLKGYQGNSLYSC